MPGEHRYQSERMPTTITTISVRPDRRDRLKEFRDEKDLSTMDEALDELLNQRGE